MINSYNNCIMNCVREACLACVPNRALNVAKEYVVPGWSDYVEDNTEYRDRPF
jgi:hypothetical protein